MKYKISTVKMDCGHQKEAQGTSLQRATKQQLMFCKECNRMCMITEIHTQDWNWIITYKNRNATNA